MKNRQSAKNYTVILTILWITISIWGIANIFSATYMQFIAKHIFPISVVTTIIIFLFCFLIVLPITLNKYNLIYKIVSKNVNIIYLVALILLFLPLLLGAVRGGAKSVIPLIIVDLQPLELIKIVIILFLAKVFSDRKLNFLGVFKLHNTNHFKDLWKLAGFMTLPLILIFLEPDLGGTIIVFLVIYVMFILNGAHSVKILKISGVILLIGIIGIIILYTLPVESLDYRLTRIVSWLHPFASPDQETWGIHNSLIGISNGGLFGVHYLNGVQKTFLANGAATDYIFVTICEEWGIIGALFTVGLILAICYYCIKIGNYAHRRFGMLYCYGYAFLLLIQLIVNIGGVTNVIPMTGVTLPFISNGINSYLFLTLGLFYCFTIQRRSSAYYKLQAKKMWE